VSFDIPNENPLSEQRASPCKGELFDVAAVDTPPSLLSGAIGIAEPIVVLGAFVVALCPFILALRALIFGGLL
jgi:hypothetical protein